MRTNTILLLFFCLQIASCKTQKITCKQLTNLSNYQLNENAICHKLIELEKDGFALSIYIDDTIPPIVERDNLFHSWVSNIDKRAMLFVDLENGESETMYSNALKEKSYLKARYYSMHSVNNVLKNENHSESILNTIDSFKKVFIEK
jgi:hypothetical protein